MAAVVILLCVVLMYFIAYTSAVQRTLHALGLFHPQDAGSTVDSSPRFIVLGMYLARLNAAFLLGMSVYLIISRTSIWYNGVAVVILCWVGSLLIRSIPWLHLGSGDMVAVLIADLERRRNWYRNTRDAVRLQAAEELLTRLRSASRIQGAGGPSG